MAPKMFYIITFFLLVSVSSADTAVDFFVADLSLPKGPGGYPCKDPSKLTVNDFVFSTLGVPGKTPDIFKSTVTKAVDTTFPALNGLVISAVRFALDVGGALSIHSHRVSELVVIMEGTAVAGFVANDNTVNFKTLNKGDIIVFPRTLYHFVINNGTTPAVGFASFNSANPGFHSVDTSLFGNNLPTEFVQKISLLDVQQVQKLKEVFGGTN